MGYQYVHWEMGAYWGVAERSFPVEWHHIRCQACAQGPMGLGCSGLKHCGKKPAEARRGRVGGGRGGEEPESGHTPFVREENREWRKARFCGENRHWSGLEAIGDPPLDLTPMDLHLVKKALGRGKQVSTI